MRVTSGMTGPYGRLNHFGHPDADVRRYYVEWFKMFADVWAELGAGTVGTQFAIFTYKDYADPVRRAELVRIALDCWSEVAEHAQGRRPALAVLGADVGRPRVRPHVEGLPGAAGPASTPTAWRSQ